ncbi:hypothetical protein [Gelidibacter sp.]|uniref:hypothetical protein n=1 Tax=Gelidibacter sp. TaxID=2018083 RepID=UPI003263F193
MNEDVDNLLKEKLETMYFQTKEWIEDMEFYEIEFNFLNTLISDRIDTTTTEDLDHKNLFRKMDLLLFKLSDEVIFQLKEHLKTLSHLLDPIDLSNNDECAKEHSRLLDKMTQIKIGVKKLKKALFKYLKNHPFKFDLDRFIKDL